MAMAKGAAWVVALRMAVRLLGVFSVVILARLLQPADYGLIALATVLVSAVTLLGALNFEVWLIRHPAPDREHYNTVWTLSIVRGLVTAALLLLLAAPVSAFFDEPRLQVVLVVLAVSTAVGSLKNVGVIDFQKHMKFDRDFQLLAGAKLGAFVVTVALAFALRNYWALVAGVVATSLLNLMLSYLLHPYRPGISLRHWHEAFHFSKWLLAGNLFSFVYTRADTFILGKLVGNQMLGLYTVAHEISNLASTELAMPIRRVMLPGYSKMLHDPPALKKSFLLGFSLILLIGMPVAAGVGVTADPLVRVMLGEKWLDAIPLVQILTLYGIATIGMANQMPLLLALGHTRLTSGLTAAAALLLLPAFYWGSSNYGVAGGALAAGIVNLLFFSCSLAATMRVLALPFGAVLAVTWRILIATAGMVGAVLWLQTILTGAGWPPALILLADVVAGAMSYVGITLVLWMLSSKPAGPERTLLEFVQQRRS